MCFDSAILKMVELPPRPTRYFDEDEIGMDALSEGWSAPARWGCARRGRNTSLSNLLLFPRTSICERFKTKPNVWNCNLAVVSTAY